MFPSVFNFTIDGDNIYNAKLDLNDNMEYDYHITGYKVDCHYTQEEVQEFIRTKKWVFVW